MDGNGNVNGNGNGKGKSSHVPKYPPPAGESYAVRRSLIFSPHLHPDPSQFPSEHPRNPLPNPKECDSMWLSVMVLDHGSLPLEISLAAVETLDSNRPTIKSSAI